MECSIPFGSSLGGCWSHVFLGHLLFEFFLLELLLSHHIVVALPELRRVETTLASAANAVALDFLHLCLFCFLPLLLKLLFHYPALLLACVHLSSQPVGVVERLVSFLFLADELSSIAIDFWL